MTGHWYDKLNHGSPHPNTTRKYGRHTWIIENLFFKADRILRYQKIWETIQLEDIPITLLSLDHDSTPEKIFIEALTSTLHNN